MKVIIIYSGKGGVGKTTTTANIAKYLIEEGNKVFILDADVNTPSMPVIFPSSVQGELLKVASLGYETKKSIYVTDSAIRNYIGECIDDINEFKPDYVLIDTPPSITEVHINLIDKIKPSGLLVITQPNTMSVTDVNRTSLFFESRGVNIIGIVENMVTNPKETNSYAWEILASIPFENDFNFNEVYSQNKTLYKKIANNLSNMDAVILANKKRKIFDETITEREVREMSFKTPSDIKFVNLSTWDYVKNILEKSQFLIGRNDRLLEELTTENIGRMVKVFEKDDRGYFMVAKAPNTEIPLITGEIGEGSLMIADSYYGTPRIKYHTLSGDVVLFPNEIIPIDNKLLMLYIQDGYMATKEGRYLPTKEMMIEIKNTFGSRVNIFDNWESIYDDILSGNLKEVTDNSSQLYLSSKKESNKKSKKKPLITIGEFGDKITGQNPLIGN